MTRLLRSIAFRLALIFALALTLTTTLVIGVVYWQFSSASIKTASRVLGDEIGSIRTLPMQQLQEQLRLRLTQDLRRLDYVELYDGDGKPMLGNLPRPFTVPARGKPFLVRNYPLASRDYDARANAVFVAQVRPDGSEVVLGRSLFQDDELVSSMLRGFVATLLPVICLAILIATVAGRRALRRLSAIQAAIGRVMAGDLDVRLPGSGESSDVGALVGAVNRMLDEFGRLIGQIRSVGDNIAHDLRTPLAVMRGRLERGLAGHSEALLREVTEGALLDLDRAMVTVAALLRISDLESGVRRGCFQPVDLAALCDDASEFYGPLAEDKGVALVVAGGGARTVFGDRDLLREALFNLVDNAVKYTPAGGRVTIEYGSGDSLLRVTDTGPGIAPAERWELCKRFFRSERTKDAPGVGLGLSIAATIIDLHGFSLDIGDARPGAVFSIKMRTGAAAAVGMAPPWREPIVA